MTGHPNLVHIDDVEAVTREKGELHSTRRRIGAAAGTRRVGLSQWDIMPGARSTPPHVHSDEEEIFYVLAGSGLSWQDGKTYAIGAGDCIVHRVQEEAHTLIAGDDGLRVLVFAEGSDTNLTWLPHGGSMWAGPHYVPLDGPHPFKADADAGPLDVPEPETERPANIVAVADIEGETFDRKGYAGVERRLSDAAGSVNSGLRLGVIPPGQVTCPPHWHTTEEEIFVLLEGSAVALLGDDERLGMRPGSVLVRPPATKISHALRAGPEGMTYLVYGTRREDDICFYPRSNKLNVLGVVFEVEPVDYWAGEESAPE